MNVDPFDENGRETSTRPFVTKVEMRNSAPSTSATIESRSGRVTCDGEQEVTEPWERAWKKKKTATPRVRKCIKYKPIEISKVQVKCLENFEMLRFLGNLREYATCDTRS